MSSSAERQSMTTGQKQAAGSQKFMRDFAALQRLEKRFSMLIGANQNGEVVPGECLVPAFQSQNLFSHGGCLRFASPGVEMHDISSLPWHLAR